MCYWHKAAAKRTVLYQKCKHLVNQQLTLRDFFSRSCSSCGCSVVVLWWGKEHKARLLGRIVLPPILLSLISWWSHIVPLRHSRVNGRGHEWWRHRWRLFRMIQVPLVLLWRLYHTGGPRCNPSWVMHCFVVMVPVLGGLVWDGFMGVGMCSCLSLRLSICCSEFSVALDSLDFVCQLGTGEESQSIYGLVLSWRGT